MKMATENLGKINGFDFLREICFSDFNFTEHGIYNILLQRKIRLSVEIAVCTPGFTEWNVKIDTCHGCFC